YQTYLGRVPSAADMTANVAAFENGVSNEQIAAAIASSDEFYLRQGGTVETFIKGLYRVILGRPADRDGFAYWDVSIIDAMQVALEKQTTTSPNITVRARTPGPSLSLSVSRPSRLYGLAGRRTRFSLHTEGSPFSKRHPINKQRC